MNQLQLVATALTVIAVLLAILIAARTDLTKQRGGKILAFVALFLLPTVVLYGGFSTHMERAQSTEFCLSCHVMEDFGRSLNVDDPSYIPAVHFQNNRVPRDRACYTCHTDYAMFGGIRAKLRGVRHLYVQYLGTIPPPDRIRLYEPFNNRECLHCHAGGRKYEEQKAHIKTPERLAEIGSNVMSCGAAKCHDTIHDVGTLADVTFWKGQP